VALSPKRETEYASGRRGPLTGSALRFECSGHARDGARFGGRAPWNTLLRITVRNIYDVQLHQVPDKPIHFPVYTVQERGFDLSFMHDVVSNFVQLVEECIGCETAVGLW
jgi:hypothetical protein